MSHRIFGPTAPSRLALKGFRFIEGEEGAAPAEETKSADLAEDKTDWKAEARKHEQRAKENAAKAKANEAAATRLAEIEEEKKSDEQKTADRIAAAEKRAAELEIKATRAEVAAAKGVPAELLSGSTLEELETAADKLLAFRGEKPEAKPDKQTLFVADEGGLPALGKAENITAGLGTLRAAYAQENRKG